MRNIKGNRIEDIQNIVSYSFSDYEMYVDPISFSDKDHKIFVCDETNNISKLMGNTQDPPRIFRSNKNKIENLIEL